MILVGGILGKWLGQEGFVLESGMNTLKKFPESFLALATYEDTYEKSVIYEEQFLPSH